MLIVAAGAGNKRRGRSERPNGFVDEAAEFGAEVVAEAEVGREVR